MQDIESQTMWPDLANFCHAIGQIYIKEDGKKSDILADFDNKVLALKWDNKILSSFKQVKVI